MRINSTDRVSRIRGLLNVWEGGWCPGNRSLVPRARFFGLNRPLFASSELKARLSRAELGLGFLAVAD